MRTMYRFIVTAVICLSIFTVNQAAADTFKKGDKFHLKFISLVVCQTPQLVLESNFKFNDNDSPEKRKALIKRQFEIFDTGLCVHTQGSIGTIVAVFQDGETVQVSGMTVRGILLKVPVWADQKDISLCKGLAC